MGELSPGTGRKTFLASDLPPRSGAGRRAEDAAERTCMLGSWQIFTESESSPLICRAPMALPSTLGLRYTSYVLRFGLAVSILAAAAPLIAADKKPSDLALHDLSGKRVQLRDYRGKIVVLNFWATWCGPCREEMPMIVEAGKTWAAKGVTFIAISLDDNKTSKNIPAFVEQYHVDFPIWTGASADSLDKIRMGEGVPDTAFLDEAGTVVARVLGEIRRAELDERLTWLTGDRKSAPPPALINHF